MIVKKDKKDLLVTIDELKHSEKKITLIPTMGNLHEGHKTLIKYAPKDTFKIVTIYVNPLQFNDRDDYTNYPRSIERDINLCKELNIDLVYAPELDITTEIDIENKIEDKVRFIIPRRNQNTPTSRFGWSWFTPLLKKYKRALILVFASSMLAQLFGLAIPLLLQQIIDKHARRKAEEEYEDDEDEKKADDMAEGA